VAHGHCCCSVTASTRARAEHNTDAKLRLLVGRAISLSGRFALSLGLEHCRLREQTLYRPGAFARGMRSHDGQLADRTTERPAIARGEAQSSVHEYERCLDRRIVRICRSGLFLEILCAQHWAIAARLSTWQTRDDVAGVAATTRPPPSARDSATDSARRRRHPCALKAREYRMRQSPIERD
jgi:hypothetical protein